MARILVVDDEVRFRELYTQTLASAGFTTAAAGSAEEALSYLEQSAFDMVVSDVRMPGADGIELLRRARTLHEDIPFLLVTAYADVRDAVLALKLGAVDYLSKPIDLDELVAAVRDTLGIRADTELQEIDSEALGDMVVVSPIMAAVVRDAHRVAQSDVTVLLTGESGTGKDVLAQFIHRVSMRARGPMVAVNCAAIPTDLIASELFGHARGAFTGATAARSGRFREASGGTLFLDEIGDMPLELQPALLRVLETGYVRPVGADRDIQVDYRLVAATNRALEAAVQLGRFRSDLYYRLNVIALDIPPLRDRREDILPLARRFLARSTGQKKRLSRAAIQTLEAHAWPGNVRELSNAMDRARLLSRTEVILPEHLPPAVRAAAAGAPRVGADASTGVPLAGGVRSQGIGETTAPSGDGVKTLAETELDLVRRALEQTGGNRTRAAELLGITRRGLIYKLKRLGL